MIRLSPLTFVRHAGGESVLWRPRTGACAVLRDAEAFLRPLTRRWRSEAELVEEILSHAEFAEFSHAEGAECSHAESAEGAEVLSRLREDFREFLDALAADGFVEQSGASAPSGPSGPSVPSHPSPDGDSDWTPLGDFFLRHGLPVELHMDLTAACTERCVHCYLPDYPNRHLPVALAKKALSEFRELQGLTVHFTGGECLIHPQFREIATLAKEIGLNILVLSNLTACDDGMTDFLADLDPQFVNVSLYSTDPAQHDAVTRRPGSWKETTAALARLKAAGVHCRIATPLLKENAGDFPALARFAAENGWHLVPNADIFPQSDHDCSNLDHAVAPDRLRAVLRDNKALFDRGYGRHPAPPPDAKVCDIGVSRLYLASTGDYYPCDGMHGWTLGNARDASVADVWRGEKLDALRALRNRDFPRCAVCPDRAFCKVCPAYNFNATGSLFETNPAKCACAAVKREIYGGEPC